MRRKILAVTLILGLMASMIAGCGTEKVAETVMNTEVEANDTQITENNNVDIEKIEETETVSEDITEDTVYSEENYKEQRDIFVVEHIDSGDGTQIDLTDAEQVNGPFILQESIDIYSYFFTYAGYTKPNIRITMIKRVGDWVFVPFAESSFLVKAEEFDRAAVLKETENENPGYTANNTDSGVEASPTSEIPAQTGNSNPDSETVVASEDAPQTEATVTTTYTEEEVISIFRSTLESNGIQWYPDSSEYAQWPEAGPSGGMGWGIENISMSTPYEDSMKSVEGFQFAGWQYYYLESQGSSNGYVHLKLYSG